MSHLYHGLKTHRLTNGILFLDALLEAGPRIVRMGFEEDRRNLLAETPDLSWDTPHGRYHLRGGHRLWHAPEAIDRTHIPDDSPPSIHVDGFNMDLTAPVEPPTGIQKAMHIQLIPEEAVVHIEHALTNHGAEPAELAVWPITQLPLGGTIILPMATHPIDEHGKLPNRNLLLWPYSRIHDPRIHMEDDVLLLEALDIPESNKIGYMNRNGWIAYIKDSALLVKSFTPSPLEKHVDMGCNVEAYLSGMFVELETLSPWRTFSPGETITHTETWHLYRIEDSPASVNELLTALRDGTLPISLKEQPAP